MGCLDIFALSSDTKRMPIALLEAMTARLPIAAADVGDFKTMAARKNQCFIENQHFIVNRDDEAASTAAIERLLREPETRERLGRQNKECATAEFSQQHMFNRYSDLFLRPMNHRKRNGDNNPVYSPAGRQYRSDRNRKPV
ncbi:MAG: glycosyltransferase [Alphaproteobacteria bacterium]